MKTCCIAVWLHADVFANLYAMVAVKIHFRNIHIGFEAYIPPPKKVILHENGTLLKPPSATAWESFQLLTITFEWTIVTDKMIWIKIKTDTIYFSSLSLTSIGFFFHYIFIIYICVWCMSYQSLASCNTISNMFS